MSMEEQVTPQPLCACSCCLSLWSTRTNRHRESSFLFTVKITEADLEKLETMVWNEPGGKTPESVELPSDIRTILLILTGEGCKDSSEWTRGYSAGQCFWRVHELCENHALCFIKMNNLGGKMPRSRSIRIHLWQIIWEPCFKAVGKNNKLVKGDKQQQYLVLCSLEGFAQPGNLKRPWSP